MDDLGEMLLFLKWQIKTSDISKLNESIIRNFKEKVNKNKMILY